MEQALKDKSFWQPNVTRKDCDSLLKASPPGSFVLRKSSTPDRLALTHKQVGGALGHALIGFDQQQNFFVDEDNIRDRKFKDIEDLLIFLKLDLKKSKKKIDRPSHVNGKRVLFQVEGLCTYIGRNEFELSFERETILNVLTIDNDYYIASIDGTATGAVPSGLTKKVKGSELSPEEMEAALKEAAPTEILGVPKPAVVTEILGVPEPAVVAPVTVSSKANRPVNQQPANSFTMTPTLKRRYRSKPLPPPPSVSSAASSPAASPSLLPRITSSPALRHKKLPPPPPVHDETPATAEQPPPMPPRPPLSVFDSSTGAATNANDETTVPDDGDIWEECEDAGTGRTFYFHPASGQSSWTPPTDVALQSYNGPSTTGQRSSQQHKPSSNVRLPPPNSRPSSQRASATLVATDEPEPSPKRASQLIQSTSGVERMLTNEQKLLLLNTDINKEEEASTAEEERTGLPADFASLPKWKQIRVQKELAETERLKEEEKARLAKIKQIIS